MRPARKQEHVGALGKRDTSSLAKLLLIQGRDGQALTTLSRLEPIRHAALAMTDNLCSVPILSERR